MSKAQTAPVKTASTARQAARLPKMPDGARPSRGKHEVAPMPATTEMKPTARDQVDATATQDPAAAMRQAVTGQGSGIVGFASRCPHCDMSIERRYVVYRRNPKTLVVIQGQWETVHVTEDGDVSGNGRCKVSPLSRYLDLDSEKGTSNYTGAKMGVNKSKSKTLHLKRPAIEVDTLGRPMITICGALGGRTTDQVSSVTCNNCKTTLNKQVNKGDKTMSTETPTTTAPMTVKEKIAAAKAKADAKKAGAPAANLVGKDGPTGKPLTGAAKVAREKAEKAPRVKKEVTVGPCGCGCNEEVERSFRPGHDARFHSWVKKVAAGTMKVSELPKQIQVGMFPGMKDAKEGVGVMPKISEANYLAGLKKQ